MPRREKSILKRLDKTITEPRDVKKPASLKVRSTKLLTSDLYTSYMAQSHTISTFPSYSHKKPRATAYQYQCPFTIPLVLIGIGIKSFLFYFILRTINDPCQDESRIVGC